MKYELTTNFIEYKGRKLYQIKALKDFDDVKAGELGGYIEQESNLSQKGDCWVADNAKVFGNAEVQDFAEVRDCAKVFGNAEVRGYAEIKGKAEVSGNTIIK